MKRSKEESLTLPTVVAQELERVPLIQELIASELCNISAIAKRMRKSIER